MTIEDFNSGSEDVTIKVTDNIDTDGTDITAINNTGRKKFTLKSDSATKAITRGKQATCSQSTQVNLFWKIS